jgi:hypothetical protein
VSLFGTDIFPYSTNFSELHVHTIDNVSFFSNQHIIELTIGYSILLIFNAINFALNDLRAT